MHTGILFWQKRRYCSTEDTVRAGSLFFSTLLAHPSKINRSQACLTCNEPCLIRMSHVSYEWFMSHMNESCCTCVIWMSHVSYEWFMSHTNEPCFIWTIHVSYEWAMFHMNELCLIWMSHLIWINNVTHKCPAAPMQSRSSSFSSMLHSHKKKWMTTPCLIRKSNASHE